MLKIGIVSAYDTKRVLVSYELYYKLKVRQWLQSDVHALPLKFSTTLVSPASKGRYVGIVNNTFRTQKMIFHDQFAEEYLPINSHGMVVFDGAVLNNLIHICLNHGDDPRCSEWVEAAAELVAEHLRSYQFIFLLSRDSLKVLGDTSDEKSEVIEKQTKAETMTVDFLNAHKIKYFNFKSVNDIIKKIVRRPDLLPKHVAFNVPKEARVRKERARALCKEREILA